jgi:hypothetical protein
MNFLEFKLKELNIIDGNHQNLFLDEVVWSLTIKTDEKVAIGCVMV